MNLQKHSASVVLRTYAPALPEIFRAEERIGRMQLFELTELRKQLAKKPSDPFLRLWQGLSLEHHGKYAEAVNEYAKAIDRGCKHWRLGWYMAHVQIDRPPSSTRPLWLVLKANPDFLPARELPRQARGGCATAEQDRVIDPCSAENPPRKQAATNARPPFNSFDVFDTLIARRFLNAEPLWRRLAVEFGIPDLVSRRVAAQWPAQSPANLRQRGVAAGNYAPGTPTRI